MPYGSYWPDMTYTLKLGDQSKTYTNTALTYIKSPGAYHYEASVDSTCREVLSNGITSLCKAGAAFAVQHITPESQFECTLYIEKNFPDENWLNLWMYNYAWPSLFTRIKRTDDNEIMIHPSRQSVTVLNTEPPMSYSLFFLNRHDNFSVKEMSDPNLMIRKILSEGETWFSGGDEISYQSILTAYAVYYLNVRRASRDHFYGQDRNSGLVSYMVASQFALKTLPVFAQFVTAYSDILTPSVLQQLEYTGVTNGPDLRTMLEAQRSGSSSRSSWS